MLNYKQFYIKIGNRKIADLVEPKVIVGENLTYPINSYLYWLNISDIPTAPTYEYGYLKNISYPLVLTPYEYSKNTKGTFNIRGNINIAKIISDFKKNSKGFKFLKPNTNNINLTSKKVLIFNYGAINTFYKYIQNPFNSYYKWYNAYATCIDSIHPNISGTDKNKFLLFQIPRALPERLILEKYTTNLTRQGLDVFINNSYFNILDLWRYLTPELKETSLLNNIPQDELNNVTLILAINNKVSLLNLGLLTSIVSEYELKSKLSKYKAKTVRKLIYLFLNKIITKAAIPLDQIQNINMDNGTIDIDNAVDISDVTTDMDMKQVEEVSDDVDNEVNDAVSVKTIDELSDAAEIDEISDDIAIDDSKPVKEIVHKKIEILESKKLISKNKSTKLKEVINKQDNLIINIPGKGKVKLKELTTYKKEDFILTKEDLKIPSSGYTNDENQLEDTIGAYDRKYINTVLDKDIINTLMSVQNNDMIVDDLNITSKKDITGELLTYDMSLLGLDGKKSSISMIIPKIDEDGSFTISGNKYILRKQKSDIPIRKIDFNRVALTSYYGKLFITKATFKKDDAGFWFKKQMLNIYGVDTKLSNLVLIPTVTYDQTLPLDYTQISRYIKSFNYDHYYYYFNYADRNDAFRLDNKELSKIEKDGKTIIAKNKNKKTYILLDNKNKYWLYKDGNYTETKSLYELLSIDRSKQPIEYSNIKIYKETLALVILLSYYLGLTNLIKRTNLKYYKIESNKRVTLEPNQYVIKFKDIKLIIDRDYGVNDMLFGGFKSIDKILKNINYKTLDNKSTFSVLYTELGLPMVYDNEIKMLLKMYLDPITKSILEELNEPTNFIDILFKSNELLTNDNYKNPNDITNMLIKGYERLAGMMYSELVKSLKAHENRSVFSNSKLNMNPYSIIAKLNEDSTTVLVDDLNPIAELKQHEDVSMIGFGGRSKDGMNRDTRIMHPSEIGIISEATKDSSDVGITAIMVANPNIKNMRGIVSKYDMNKDSISKTMSTTSLLYPAANQDDVKRSNFANIQSSHVIPINGSKVCPMRTGYEAILPYRISDKFIIHAEKDGTVIDINKKFITVQYKGDSNTTKYPIKKWNTKEESGTTYTHKLIPNFTKGAKFKEADTLLYTPSYFEPDMFNSNRCIFKSSVNIDVAIIEEVQTFEDSCSISKSTSNLLTTTVTKTKSVIVNNTDDIINLVKPNDKVKPNDILFTITDESISKLKGLDNDALEALKRLKQNSPKSKYNGVIDKFLIFYNCEYGELSETLKTYVDISNKQLQLDKGDSKLTGQVSKGYSIQGKSLQPGQVEIKLYINIVEGMGVADKLIFGNQLKSTVGEVYNYTMETEDGAEIDAIFGMKSIANRIVNSPFIIGTTSKVLEVLTDKAVELYFGK